MSLYHPISRASSQRDISGCLTPTNLDNKPISVNTPPAANFATGAAVSSSGSSSTALTVSSARDEAFKSSKESSRKTSILSPPLSPYQREEVATVEPIEIVSTKVFIPLEQPFKIENYKEYDLKVNPWSNLNGSYKSKQFKFLEQYSIISSKEKSTMKIIEKRHIANNRKRISSSDSDSEIERVRTRRIVKESSVNLSEIENNDRNVTPSSPKKRKTTSRKETTYHPGSPLAIQQAALIDENIPDYSPDPASTLPKGNNRCLKVEWKGQPMDLRFDPNIEKLHPAEVLLASILRLPCNVYLDSKRRLFFEKVNRLKRGQQFRRTDAQKACRIDVNKASRLFAAFEKAKWLEDDHFAKYL